MHRILVASSNKGKLRDFAAAASFHGIEIASIPQFDSLREVIEDRPTFEGNAEKKAEFYSLHTSGEAVLADDSGLAVDALNGAPGVYSARYASSPEHPNATDTDNNAKLLRELANVPDPERTARFVCVIAVARNGQTLATFRGEAEGIILHEPRGSAGFGYDPLFFFPRLDKTFAELTTEDKATVSHRGQAFRQMLHWADNYKDW
jgi:XTP/dITP diphosphohydrolase